MRPTVVFIHSPPNVRGRKLANYIGEKYHHKVIDVTENFNSQEHVDDVAVIEYVLGEIDKFIVHGYKFIVRGFPNTTNQLTLWTQRVLPRVCDHVYIYIDTFKNQARSLVLRPPDDYVHEGLVDTSVCEEAVTASRRDTLDILKYFERVGKLRVLSVNQERESELYRELALLVQRQISPFDRFFQEAPVPTDAPMAGTRVSAVSGRLVVSVVQECRDRRGDLFTPSHYHVPSPGPVKYSI
eukprot:GHVR01062158.1.p1 GENE.GHVR01062158.1~~GHVR01062158.1.p1  ORF type:complete len:240 (+),score=41.28 GHVR01062158.1:106-825(+)